MQTDVKAFYDEATELLAELPNSRAFMEGTAKCLRKTYVTMHSALGTQASVEIGAREAGYSLEMADMYGDAIALYALEASPKTHAHFSREINYKERGVRYINALVSDSEGETLFYEYREAGEPAAGLSSIHVRDVRSHGATTKTRTTVKALRGDTFIANNCKNHEKIALWIDVEGAQYEVLRSLSETFAQGRINSVFIEVERKKMWPKQKMLDNDVIKFMNDYSFTQFLRDKQFGVQYNSIFVNDAVTGCDFPTFAEYYRMMLQKLHQQEVHSDA